MTSYFKTRKEARQFCDDQNIRKKNIEFIGLGATLKAGYPWIVPTQTGEAKLGDTAKPFAMEVGKTYRLVDPELFISAGTNWSINKLQVAELQKHYDSKIKIVSYDSDSDYRYEVESLDHFSLISSKETAAFKLVEETVDSLDGILDGGENLAPAVEEPVVDFNKPLTVQRNPDVFVVGRRYALVDKKSFVSANGANPNIVRDVDANHGGVYTIGYRKVGGDFTINGMVFNQDSKNPVFLTPDERSFFAELPDLQVAELSPPEPLASDLLTLLTAAVKRHDDALDEVSSAFKEVMDIQRQIAKLNA